MQHLIEEFNKNKYFGLSSTIDIKNCNHNKIKNISYIRSYIFLLCELIEMVPVGSPKILDFGSDERIKGISFMQLIETSSITGHFANFTNNVYIDIFSCKLYDPFKVSMFTQEYFDGKENEVHFHFRK